MPKINKGCSISTALLHLSLKSPGKQIPSMFPNGESYQFPETSFTCPSNSSIKVLLIKKIHPSLEGPRKGAPPHIPQNGAPMETDAHFQILTLEYPSRSQIREPYFIHLSNPPPSTLPGSLVGPLWRDMPVSRAFLYVSFSVPSKESPSRFP
jgi:hypothetical protein